MNIEFGNQNLFILYITGKCSKPKLTEEIKKKFFMRIRQLEAATTIYDLWATPSLNFEHLPGHIPPYSLRLDRQWRLEFDIEWQDENKTVGKVTLLKISKHYGD